MSKPDSKYVGVIGEKISIKTEVVYVNVISNSFGFSNIYRMVDDKGNIIIKFGTINERYISDDSEEIKKGTKLEFNTMVKQTVIGRVSKFKK